MPRVVPEDDFALIERTEALGESGLTMSAAASLLGKPLTTVRAAVERHGFELVTCFQVRAKLGGIKFSATVKSGDVVSAETAEAIEAEVAA
jgi:hypothetical protein